MNFSKEWLIFICIVCISSSVIATLIPKSSASKIFGYLSAIILIYAFLMPVISLKDNLPDLVSIFGSAHESSAEFEENSNKTALEAAETGYENAILSMIREKSISVRGVKAECEISGGEIVVNSVSVEMEQSETNKRAVSSIIETIAGKRTKIIFIGGER